jgi:hypothetical protein
VTVDIDAARALLDFGKRIGDGDRAEAQLEGAVAVHNILAKHRVAYLADEVGMGKTYVALGALALFRHFNPNFRALVIAPRKNIQRKWQKEFTNFVAHNVRFDDLRVRGLDGRPARPLVNCENLVELAHATSLDPDRDFFLRSTSFSLALGQNDESWKKPRDALQRHIPWLSPDVFSLRNKGAFKRNFARALCCALPHFDLVIIDEAHNLKHGLAGSASGRNRALADAFGRHDVDDPPDPKLLPGYGPRVGKVLFLSATPLEESYHHIWNQLDIFGLTRGFDTLRDGGATEEQKKATAAQFLVRRVTNIRVAGQQHTKNMYRREWRAGGVTEHDKPIHITDERERLVVALVQKKVSEVLADKRFNNSFQIGMLASFESFLETAKLKRDSTTADEDATFDDADQTDVAVERDGIDVHALNRLAKNYRKTFGRELPHPKMDAVVDSLTSSWMTGTKTLVFVRRVASVKELKRKLDERYDDWLLAHLRERLSSKLHTPLDNVIRRYRQEKEAADTATRGEVQSPIDVVGTTDEVADSGGTDTFFAWFFRGEGPTGLKGLPSGANIQGRFIKGGGAFATFFTDNHVMDLLGAPARGVLVALAAAIERSVEDTAALIRARAPKYLSRKAKVPTRADRVRSTQAAAMELLHELGPPETAKRARIVWEERYQSSLARDAAKVAPAEVVETLEVESFFTALRRPEHAGLQSLLWPVAPLASVPLEGFRAAFREQELRAELLATAARLGHAFIDLYLAVMADKATTSIQQSDVAGEVDEVDDADPATEAQEDGRPVGLGVLGAYLQMLEAQRRSAPPRRWGALDELGEIAANFWLIVDVNAADVPTAPLAEASRTMGRLLRQQQPVGGMSGTVNQTLVRQFRMPGYPFVLVTTDLLQEGEDLHTFCSSVHHYGISWTPSAMEQRIGRIDRVRSQTDRRLTALGREPAGADRLQVHLPYLQDTVEVLQVERVLGRMDTFLRLMHEGLAPPTTESRRIDVGHELLAVRPAVAGDTEPLRSAFPIPEWATKGTRHTLAVQETWSATIHERLARLAVPSLGGLSITWSELPPPGALLGTATLPNGRVQPFTLLQRSEQGHIVLRCVSPIGRTDPQDDPETIIQSAMALSCRVGAILTREERTYDLTVEDDVLLGKAADDAARVGLLVRRVTTQADAMEQDQFDDGRDAAIDVFVSDLRKEAHHGD